MTRDKLAQEIHMQYMIEGRYMMPDFDDIYHEMWFDSSEDHAMGIQAIEYCLENWTDWTRDWKREEAESKEQARWESANRGEI